LPLQNVNNEGELQVVEDMVDLPFLHEVCTVHTQRIASRSSILVWFCVCREMLYVCVCVSPFFRLSRPLAQKEPLFHCFVPIFFFLFFVNSFCLFLSILSV
jgi:hypothetical protein